MTSHGEDAGGKKHAAMGFHDGWGKALDQRGAHARKPKPA